MKNLRKVFAVVLVVAMVFSLMAVASAKQVTDYSDTSKMKYTEAVDLVTGLGIMTGSGDTAFDPTGTFTREQAAKVICYLLVGSSVASTLSASTSNFSDVAVTRWSAPFIQYCYTAGIINGSGDGKFNPEASVTGTAFAKMLLTALGYGAKGEYTGANWELNTLVKAQALGILNTSVNYSAAATREEVAKYAFNALTKCYPQTFNSVTGAYQNTLSDTTSVGGILIKDTLGYSTFQLLKTDVTNTYKGALAHYWKAYTTTTNTTVTGTYSDDTVLFTGTGAPYGIVNATTANSGYYKVSLEASGVKYYLNGTEQTTDAQITALKTLSSDTGIITKYIDNTTAGASGTASNGLADIVYVYQMSVAKLNAAPTVDAAGNVTLSTTAGALNQTFTKDNLTYPTGLAAKDYVTYVQWAGAKTAVEKATKVTGQLTAANASIGMVTFAGNAYFKVYDTNPYTHETVMTGASICDLSNSANYNVAATAWVDNNGFVIYLQPDSTASYNVGLVVGYTFTPNAVTGGTAQVRLYTNEGKVAVYDIAPATTTADATSNYPATTAGSVPDQRHQFTANATLVTYTFNASNQVKIVPVEKHGTVGGSGSNAYAAKTATVAVNAGSPATTSNYYINAATKVVYFDLTSAWDATSHKGTVLTGFGGTTDVAAGSTIYYITDPDNTQVLDAIFFGVRGPLGTSGNYAYITVCSYNLRTVSGVTYYDYSVLVNGDTTAKTLTATSPIWTPFVDSGLWSYDVDSNGYVTNPAKAARPTAPTKWKVTYVDSSFIGFTDGTTNSSINVNADTKYFQVNPNTYTATAAPISASTAGTTTYITDYVLNTNVTGSPVLYVYYVVQ